MPEIYLPDDDSYLLAKSLKKIVPRNKKNKFLEIGPGSGIQLKTLNEIGIKKENIFSSDINPDAVKHCKSLGFNCMHSNLFQKIPEQKFDFIIFNPPYLPEDKKNREPKDSKLSTTGGRNGSEIINEFLKEAKKYLAKNGKIILLTSSLTKKIKWGNYKKKLIASKKIFFEELLVWELELS